MHYIYDTIRKRKYPSQNVGIVESMINLNQLMHIITFWKTNVNLGPKIKWDKYIWQYLPLREQNNVRPQQEWIKCREWVLHIALSLEVSIFENYS